MAGRVNIVSRSDRSKTKMRLHVKRLRVQRARNRFVSSDVTRSYRLSVRIENSYFWISTVFVSLNLRQGRAKYEMIPLKMNTSATQHATTTGRV